MLFIYLLVDSNICHNLRRIAMKTCLASIVLYIFMSALCPLAQAQQAPERVPPLTKEVMLIGPNLTDLTQRLQLQRKGLRSRVNLLDSTIRLVREMKSLEADLASTNPDERKEAEELLDKYEALSHFVFNDKLEDEMAPLLIGRLRHKTPPAHPTKLQQRLLDTSQGRVDLLADEIIKEIVSDKEQLEREQIRVS